MNYRDYFKITGVSAYFLAVVYLLKPVLSPYIKSFGFNAFELSLFFSVFPLVLIFTSSYFGDLSDQIGRKRVILIGISLEIVAIFFYMIGTPWIFIILGRILDAIAIGCVTLIVLAKVEDLVTSKNRGKLTGLSLSINNIGILIAPLVGGIIADRFFVKAPFILSIFLLLILTIFFFKGTTYKYIHKKNKINIFLDMREFLSIRKLKGMAILGIAAHASIPATYVFLPLLIINKFGLSYSYVGFAFFIFSFTHLLQSLFGNLADKYGTSKLLLIGMIIRMGGLFFVAFANSYETLLIILAIAGTGGSMFNVSAWSIMSEIGEQFKKEGNILGSYMSIAKIGAFVSFIVSGLIVQFSNIETLFKVIGIIGIIGAILASIYITNIFKYGKESIRYHWSG